MKMQIGWKTRIVALLIGLIVFLSLEAGINYLLELHPEWDRRGTSTAKVENVTLCINGERSFEPYILSLTDGVSLCGDLISTTPINLGVLIYDSEDLVYNNPASDAVYPGPFMLGLPFETFDESGRYALQVWIARRQVHHLIFIVE